MPRTKTAKPENETKEAAFVRLATLRVGKALNAIRVIGNLGRYPHTTGQTAKILFALRASIEEVEYAMAGEKPGKVAFSLTEAEEE